MEIIVAGAGFSGLYAVKKLAELSRKRQDVNIRLFNSTPYTTMLPALPDLAGGYLQAKYLTEEIHNLINKHVIFHQETIKEFDLHQRRVVTEKDQYPYDNLIIGTGSITNFFGFDQHLDKVFTLDSLDDAVTLNKSFSDYINSTNNAHAVVVGGGYTGLELACNLRRLADNHNKQCQISILELKQTILPMMPEKIRAHIQQQALKNGFNILTTKTLKRFDGADVQLSDGSTFKNVFVCWTTGTKFAVPEIKGNFETIRDGRIVVDSKLRIPNHPEVFAVGDAAAIKHGNQYLRKAVNFAIDSGVHAATNIVRTKGNKAVRDFTPRDLGWVIPFGNTAAGVLFNKLKITGSFPLRLHYFMCGLRNYNIRNRFYFWQHAIRKPKR